MKKLFFLVLLLSNCIGLAQYSLIPDVNFEKALIGLGMDSGLPDGKVLTANIKYLTQLDVSYHGITDLTGIQDFVNLKIINCDYNLFTSIDLSKNISLEYIDCSNNQMVNLNISKNIALTNLNCIANQLTNLDTSKNINLIELDCRYNKINTLDVSKNIVLTSLTCSANQLNNLNVSKNVLLQELECSENQIINLDISNNTFLSTLRCEQNQLMILDLSKNTSLHNFTCNKNNLSLLNIKNGSNLNLSMSVNNFKDNPNLKCIVVDNASNSNDNLIWQSAKDATARYSEDCNKTIVAIAPPVITASGNQIYCAGKPINIIPPPAPTENISITFDPLKPDTDAVYVQISSGYVAGFDLLSLTNFSIHQAKNIFHSWDATTGKLKLFSPTGSEILYTDFVAALKDVIFSNSEISPSGARTFSITIGQANYLPSTQHFYEYVPKLGISWTDAKLAAEGRNYFGLKGYLATILAADEAQLTGKQSSGAGWIGGSDAQTEGVWKWVTGPEGLLNAGTGIVFWNGGVGGLTPNFAFWNSNEPNQFAGAQEDYAHITAPGVGITGSWNDLTLNGDPNGSYQPKGYIVEYGGMPLDPTLQIAASTSISIPRKADFQSASRCFAGSVTLQPIASLGSVSWYDAQTGGTILEIGNTFTTPNISTTTSYFVDATNGACPLSSSNPRIEVVAKIISPTVTASSILSTPICGNGKTTLNAIASTGSTLKWYNANIGGTLLGTGLSYTTPNLTLDTTFYVDATESSCVSARTPIMASVLTVPTITSTTPATRCDTGIVTLEAVGSAGILNWYDSDKGGTQVGTGNTISTPSISLTTPFYVDTTEAGCTSLRTAVLASIYPIDTDDKEVVLCQTKTATLDASIPGLDYLWSPGGEITQSINVSTIGNYEVIISSPIATSCGSKKIFNVIEHPKPVIAELITDDTTLTILLTDPKEYYEFSIDGVLFQKSNQFSYILSGQQTAYVRENNTCNLIEQDFTIFSISKYFTPNNDGINDTWLIPEMKDYPGSNVKIFDRYGKLLKQLNAGIIGWNGKFNNIDLPADDYWYVLKLESNQPEIRAHFTLKR